MTLHNFQTDSTQKMKATILLFLSTCNFFRSLNGKVYEVGVLLPFSGARPIGRTSAGAIPIAFGESF